MSRPRKYVNRHILKELCQAQLSNDEISRVLRVSWDTLERRYAEAIKAWRMLGPASVRRELYLTAMGTSKGKLGAMIFYLKNYGGMADKASIPLEDGFKVTVEHIGSAHKAPAKANGASTLTQ